MDNKFITRRVKSKEDLLKILEGHGYRKSDAGYANMDRGHGVGVVSPMFRYCGKSIQLSKSDRTSEVYKGEGYNWLEEWLEPDTIKIKLHDEGD